MIGELLPTDPPSAGPYRLVGRLGAGGMGQVYLARSPGGRQVAVKVIRPELAGEPGFRARFAREVAAARNVGGMFTAPVVDADTDGPMPWLATAYVPGPSLAEAVAERGPLPAEAVRALGAGLAEGLQAIHAAGVVHRDLKPSNVLLADDGPRVIDFGISRAAEASMLTAAGALIGSPGFLSPEQAKPGQQVGEASDVFSLGAVLVFAATGLGPFGAGHAAALLYRVVSEEPNLSGVPAELRPVIARCLAKEPADRPTPGELLAWLGGGEVATGWRPDADQGVFDDQRRNQQAGAQDLVADSDWLAEAAVPVFVPDEATEVSVPVPQDLALVPGGPAPGGPAPGGAVADGAVADGAVVDADATVAAQAATPAPATSAVDPDSPQLEDSLDGDVPDRQVPAELQALPARQGRVTLGRRRLAAGTAAGVAAVALVAVTAALLAPAGPGSRPPASLSSGPVPSLLASSASSLGSPAAAATLRAGKKPGRQSSRTATAGATTTTQAAQTASSTPTTAPPASTPGGQTPTPRPATHSPTPSPPAAPPPGIGSYSGATEYSCGAAPAASSGALAAFQLVNDSSVTVDVNGQPIPAGGTSAVGGAVGDVMTVQAPSGCLGVFKQTGSGQIVVV